MTHRPGFRALDKDLGRIGHAEVAQMHAFRPVWRLGLAVLALVGGLLMVMALSGAAPGSFGSLLEITEGGKHPVELASGEVRKFLEDGDEIILRARCTRDGVASIGFGECRAQSVLQAAQPVGDSGGVHVGVVHLLCCFSCWRSMPSKPP